ncbi:hypothetical protein GGE26_003410 [Agrobacterium tumefaciens]|nr:hypothetical protein [Agrobacterium radiobacter]
MRKNLPTLPSQSSGRCSIRSDANVTNRQSGFCIGPCMCGHPALFGATGSG